MRFLPSLARLGLSSGSSYCAQSLAFFARLATQPASARAVLYDTMIGALASAGVWAKLDGLYVFAAADSATALTNLVQASFGATAVNTPAFTANTGYAGGSTAYLDTGFNPATAGGLYARDDASAFQWSDKAAHDGAQIGTVGNTNANPVEINSRFGDNHAYGGLNINSEVALQSGVTDGSGFRALTRTGSAGFDYYSGATNVGTVTAASAAVASHNIEFLSHGTTLNPFSGHLYAGGFGRGLSSADVTALYNALHAYLQAVAGVA